MSYKPTQHWTDRTYGGQGRYSNRTTSQGHGQTTNRGNFRGNNRIRLKDQENGTQSDSSKKCYVCGKTGCWSTNHTADKRKKAYDQYLVENTEQDDEYQQFLEEFEGKPEGQEPGTQESGNQETTI